MTYQLLLTTIGQQKIAAAATPGARPVRISEFAIGQAIDIDFSQRLNEQVLVSPVYQGPIHAIHATESMNRYEVACIVPQAQGGFTIREVGLIDDDGDMIWVGRVPEVQKPDATSTAAVDYRIKAVISIDNPSVTLVVDANVIMATQAWVNANFVSNPRFAAFLELAYPFGHKYWSASETDPTPLFNAMFGYDTYWRRLEGLQLVAVRDGDHILGDSGLVAGNATLLDAALNGAVKATHYTGYLWERYDPNMPIRHNGISKRDGISKFSKGKLA